MFRMYASNFHSYTHLILALGIVREPTVWVFITSNYPGTHDIGLPSTRVSGRAKPLPKLSQSNHCPSGLAGTYRPFPFPYNVSYDTGEVDRMAKCVRHALHDFVWDPPCANRVCCNRSDQFLPSYLRFLFRMKVPCRQRRRI